MAPSSSEDPLVAQAFDTKQHENLARAIDKLSSDEAAFFLHKLEHAIRKRKVQITGYLVAMLVWAVGTAIALYYFGTHDGFVGWVFLVPFAFVGIVLFAFGTWAERVGKTPPPADLMAKAKAARMAAQAETAQPAVSGEIEAKAEAVAPVEPVDDMGPVK